VPDKILFFYNVARTELRLSTLQKFPLTSMALRSARVRTKPNYKALTKNLPRIKLLVSVLGLRNFQIPGRYSVIGFMILDIIG
jgi:hypothetical protein